MPADIYDINAAFRARLLERDAKAAGEIIKAYRSAYTQLRAELDKALKDIASDPDSVAYRVSRLRVLEGQLTDELAAFAVTANAAVTESQSHAVRLAVEGQGKMLSTSLTPAPAGIQIDALFTQLPKEAMAAFVGFASDGSPLKALFAEIAPGHAESVRDRLLGALALGQGPDKVAEAFADEMGVPLTRALRIARTETMRAYRESSRSYLEANSDFIKGYVWLSARDNRVCSVCWAMDGQEFPTDEIFGTHVNCRCTLVPLAKSWADMGYPGEVDLTWKPKDTGAEVFAGLSDQEQRAILGKGKFDLYKAGKIKLSDLVEKGADPRWGPFRAEKPLHRVVPGKKATPSRKKAIPNAPAKPVAVPPTAVPNPGKPKTAQEARNQLAAASKDYIEELRTLRAAEVTATREVWNASRYDPSFHTKRITYEAARKAYRERIDAVCGPLRDILALDDHITATPRLHTSKKGIRDRAKAAFAETSRIVNRTALRDITVDVHRTTSGRCYARSIPIGIHMSDEADIATHMHELGHVLTFLDKDLSNAAVAFRTARRGNESLAQLKDLTGLPYFRHDEVSFVDKWGEGWYYCGKVYRAPACEEIVSMGIERYWYSPAEFAADDPEYFDFIFNVLRGLA